MSGVWASVLVATVLWFIMFSPYTSGIVSFWPLMSVSGIVLTLLAFWLGGNPFEGVWPDVSSVSGIGHCCIFVVPVLGGR